MLRGLFYLLIGLLFARTLGYLFARGRPRRPPPAGPGPGSDTPTRMVRDPVCGTFVPESSALAARIEGRSKHFCSKECRDRALAGVD